VTRQQPSLRVPLHNEELQGFPTFRLEKKRVLWRMVRDGHGPWWFGSLLSGRFDLPAPHGACYLASDDLGATLERLGPDLLPGGLAHRSLFRNRHLKKLHVPRLHKLANCLVLRAIKWVTAEISTLTPYDIPQAWAVAWHRAGLHGVRYSARHATSYRIWSLALFGPAGERSNWPKGTTVRWTEFHEQRLRQRCGITLFDTPYQDELVFAKLPRQR